MSALFKAATCRRTPNRRHESVRKTKRTKRRRTTTEDQARGESVEPRTRRERQAEKEAIAAERRAIKKAARRHLKQQLLEELEETK